MRLLLRGLVEVSFMYVFLLVTAGGGQCRGATRRAVGGQVRAAGYSAYHHTVGGVVLLRDRDGVAEGEVDVIDARR
ncbi:MULTISPECIES: hypothetical protein [unclassified Micromonospora]|uniref:Uncharacterized protein n=1 Tax=Micromonospora carbonacea TaxID=47853 RepID=A0A7D6CED8_9ACTN|nr:MULTISPECIES: hypothetical protein [unclassified Micromonospora]QLJ99509.1 hypothetical protein HZU44_05125 [Micromonospora carbonacea]